MWTVLSESTTRWDLTCTSIVKLTKEIRIVISMSQGEKKKRKNARGGARRGVVQSGDCLFVYRQLTPSTMQSGYSIITFNSFSTSRAFTVTISFYPMMSH